jgi:peptide/nickel transport system permease protein
VKRSQTLYLLRRNPISFFAVGGLLLIIGVAIFGPFLVSYSPYAADGTQVALAPSAAHWFGTDQLGRDILSRVVSATRLDLMIAFAAVLLSSAVGALIGGACGLIGGTVDNIVGRIVDVMMAFPLFVLAIALVAALGNTLGNIILATAIVNLPFYIRLARGEVRTRRNQLYVDAAYLAGHRMPSVLMRILLPNALPLLIVQMSIGMGWAISNVAGLSFIGLGIAPPTAEWGIMVAEGANDILSGTWWTSLFPGLALTFTIFCFNLMGDGLRDIFDPRMRT